MFLDARTEMLYFFVQEAQAFMSSEGDIYLSFYANEPSGMPHGVRAVAARGLITLDEDISVYPVEALRRGWLRSKFYVPLLQGDSLASAFQSGAIPFRGVFNMDDVNGVIRGAQAVPGVSVAVRSASTLRGTEPARSSSGGATQGPEERQRSQSTRAGQHPLKHSMPSKSPDVTVRPKVEPEQDMPVVL